VLRRLARRLRRSAHSDLVGELQAIQGELRAVAARSAEASQRAAAALDVGAGIAQTIAGFPFLLEAAHNWSKAGVDAILRFEADAARRAESLAAGTEEGIRALSNASSDLASVTLEKMAELADLVADLPAGRFSHGRLPDITSEEAAFLNYCGSHLGPLADVGLWLNQPVSLEWQRGGVAVGGVNERIVEQPFVFAAVDRLPRGSRVLDVGGGESTVALALASLGYDVTVIEPQGYPFTHPNLTVFSDRLERFDTDVPFDAVVVLSAIEHFGIGHYEGAHIGAKDDRVAMRKIHDLVRSQGFLVLTAPFGPAEVNEVERVYDDAGLRELLDSWTIETVEIVRQTGLTTWVRETDALIKPDGAGRVVMLIARPIPQ